jgi:hypothetical protein
VLESLFQEAVANAKVGQDTLTLLLIDLRELCVHLSQLPGTATLRGRLGLEALEEGVVEHFDAEDRVVLFETALVVLTHKDPPHVEALQRTLVSWCTRWVEEHLGPHVSVVFPWGHAMVPHDGLHFPQVLEQARRMVQYRHHG